MLTLQKERERKKEDKKKTNALCNSIHELRELDAKKIEKPN